MHSLTILSARLSSGYAASGNLPALTPSPPQGNTFDHLLLPEDEHDQQRDNRRDRSRHDERIEGAVAVSESIHAQLKRIKCLAVQEDQRRLKIIPGPDEPQNGISGNGGTDQREQNRQEDTDMSRAVDLRRFDILIRE